MLLGRWEEGVGFAGEVRPRACMKRTMAQSQENLCPQVLQAIARDLRKLVGASPEGITVVVNEQNVTDIQADIEGPIGTPYEGGVFRCKLVLSNDFPTTPPRGFFLTKIFHPNVAANGDICVNTLKKDWSPDLGMGHIFQVIRCLLIIPFPESALNEDASKMFLESYDEYARRAKLMTSIHAMRKCASGAGEQKCGDATGASSSSSSSSSSSNGSSSSSSDPIDAAPEEKENATIDAKRRATGAPSASKPTPLDKQKMDRKRNLKRL